MFKVWRRKTLMFFSPSFLIFDPLFLKLSFLNISSPVNQQLTLLTVIEIQLHDVTRRGRRFTGHRPHERRPSHQTSHQKPKTCLPTKTQSRKKFLFSFLAFYLISNNKHTSVNIYCQALVQPPNKPKS